MKSAGVTPRVVCVGLATIDAVVSVDQLPGSDERVAASDGRLSGGGVAATAAVTLARLGVPVAFVGRVSDDGVGRWIRDGLADEGVDVSGLALVPGRSPLSVVLVEPLAGTRALAPFLGDLGRARLTDGDLERCAAADWIHLDHVGIGVLPDLRSAGIRTPVSFDQGLSMEGLHLDGIELYAPTAGVLRDRYPGRSLEDAMRAALDEGPRLAVATRGADGSVAAERSVDGIEFHRADPFRLDMTAGSTLGAGDVFHGALLAALLDGGTVPGALRWANLAAALACRALDARSAIPSRPELEAKLYEASRSAAMQPAASLRSADG